MATLQKFKLFATHCSILGAPTGAPTSSPVVHIRRRKTLRMLLGNKSNAGAFERRFLHQNNNNRRGETEESKPQRSKLKDLFVSSPPLKAERVVVEGFLKDGGGGGGGGGVKATVRQRLLMRRGWRPVLVAIPELSP